MNRNTSDQTEAIKKMQEVIALHDEAIKKLQEAIKNTNLLIDLYARIIEKRNDIQDGAIRYILTGRKEEEE